MKVNGYIVQFEAMLPRGKRRTFRFSCWFRTDTKLSAEQLLKEVEQQAVDLVKCEVQVYVDASDITFSLISLIDTHQL